MDMTRMREIQPIPKLERRHDSLAQQDETAHSSDDGDCDMQLQDPKDDLANTRRPTNELIQLQEENGLLRTCLREAETSAEEFQLKVEMLQSKIAAQEFSIEVTEMKLDARNAKCQSLQQTIDRLERQLQQECSKTEKIQEELDNVRTKCIAMEASTLKRTENSLGDIQHLENTNRVLSQTIRDMKIERESMDKARQELDRNCQDLEKNLKRAEQEYRDIVAHKERLEEEEDAVRQQLDDAHEREKRHLQLIQDLEQEIHFTAKRRWGLDLPSVTPPATSMAALVDRLDKDRMSDQVEPQIGSTEFLSAVTLPDIAADTSVGSSLGFSIPRQNSSGKPTDSVSAPSSVGPLPKPRSVAGMDDTWNDRKRPEHLGTSYALLIDSPTELNVPDGDPARTYTDRPQPTEVSEYEIDDDPTNGSSGRSIKSSSPSPDCWNGESQPGQHASRMVTPARSTGQLLRAGGDVPRDGFSAQQDQLDSGLGPETFIRRPSGELAAGGNAQRSVGTGCWKAKPHLREMPPGSAGTAVQDSEKRVDVACPLAPQSSPPSSNKEGTSREVAITRSYTEHGLGHIPIQFCPSQGALSGLPFSPYAVRLTPRGERTLAVTDADVGGLSGTLEEMTRHIPSVDDDDLIKYLRDHTKPIEDLLHLSHSEGITGLINSLAEKETYHRYAKTFMAILKYSLMAVQRYCQGDAQFDAMAEREFKFKFNSSDRLMLDACQCLHRLCSDLHLTQVWNGRHLQLYVYLWIAKEKKDYFVPTKRPWRYDAILRRLKDPCFISQHQPSTQSSSLGQTTWFGIVLDLLGGRVKTSDVRRALGYDESYGSSSFAGHPLTPTPTPWLKRKRDVHAGSEAEAQQSTPCPKTRRLNDNAGLREVLESLARTPAINSQFCGQYGEIGNGQVSTTNSSRPVRDASKPALDLRQQDTEATVQPSGSRVIPPVSLERAIVGLQLIVRNNAYRSSQKRKFVGDDEFSKSDSGTGPRKRARFVNENDTRSSSTQTRAITPQTPSAGKVFQVSETDEIYVRRAFESRATEPSPGHGHSDYEFGRIEMTTLSPGLAILETDPAAETAEHVSNWDWSSLQTQALGYADCSAFQTNANGEIFISEPQDGTTTDGRSTSTQLLNRASNATRDHGISLESMANLPHYLGPTSCSPHSPGLMSGDDTWFGDHSLYVEDVLPQNCDFSFDLQDDYYRSNAT